MIIHNSMVFCYTSYQGYRREAMDSCGTPLPCYGPNLPPESITSLLKYEMTN